jgi:hypothetical protein
MGVLDEAIRQHIELKRRHGASEQELQRKQDEALGPARRESPDAESAPAADPAETPFSEQETRIFSATEEPGDVALVDEPDAEASLEDPDDAALVDEADEAEAGRRDAGAAPPVDDWLEPDPAPVPSAAPGAAEPSDEPEDVLEETPEFLQETPEHDRLWFEQKPPRDFDFDDDK